MYVFVQPGSMTPTMKSTTCQETVQIVIAYRRLWLFAFRDNVIRSSEALVHEIEWHRRRLLPQSTGVSE